MLNINFVKEASSDDKISVIFVDNLLKLDSKAVLIDQKYQGLITKTVADKRIFLGKFGESKTLTTTDLHGTMRNIIIIGIGDEAQLKASHLEELGGKIFSSASAAKAVNIEIILSARIAGFSCEEASTMLASGLLLASYNFDKYFTKKKEDEKQTLELIEFLVDDTEKAKELFISKRAVVSGVFTARDYVSEPPNILCPSNYADMIINELEPLGVSVEVLGEREMKNLGMGALLGVGQGSQNESKLVVMHYSRDCCDKKKPIALVGKGVTFDTGGISLKPAANMWDMKYDMAGSAAVVGTIKALALRKAKTNIVGIVGLVENMPSGNAQRPGDIVTTMSGQTAEVLNTDAEGRLVLADAVWYAQEKFQPECIVDLATLTGAIISALGYTYAGCFANNDKLADQLIAAGNQVDERLWRMPLDKEYDKMLKSDIADIANISNGMAAGSATAAHFIGRFIKDDVAWAHLDIAGVAWERKGKNICPKGAVGYGVRLLNQFIKDNYEE